MKANYKTVNEVYKGYVEIAKSFDVKDKVVLKTDCHNESMTYSHSIPIIPEFSEAKEIYCLEYDSRIILRAEKILNEYGVVVSNGTISNPGEFYDDEKFDIVFDFSTIDHVTIEELPIVIKAYKKILKKGGVLSLVILTSKELIVEANGNQMYFPFSLVDSIMKEEFVIEEDYNLHTIHGIKHLWYYRGKKE